MWMKVKAVFTQFIASGVAANSDAETKRKASIVNLFGLVGAVITFIMGINALMTHDLPLGVSLLFSSGIYILALYLQRRSKRSQNYRWAATLLQLNLIGLMLYLVHSGGQSNTGPLWMFLIPPVLMFFSGLRRGMLYTSLFIALYCLLMFYPSDQLLAAEYSFEFKTRLLFSFMTLTFLAGFYENSRHLNYLHLKDLSAEFERQARIDHLTNLPNRRAMKDSIEYEVARARRNKQPTALMLLDIDYFKRINDQYGHDCGDIVLVEMAKFFKAAMRKQDIVCRWGGEEFLFMLPQTSLQDAYVLAEKLRSAIATHIWELGHCTIEVTVSVGISEISDGISIEGTIKQADDNLYQAKNWGRNQVQPKPISKQAIAV